MRQHPHLFEINAGVFLHRLSLKYKTPLTLGTIPDQELENFKSLGFDLIWFMGVWKKSPAARAAALSNKNMRAAYDFILPDWKESDIQASPYAIYGYEVDQSLGGNQDLSILKKRLNQLGIGLVLDFVPNHLAIDHPWTLQYPQRFIQATPKAYAEHPDYFFKTEKGDRLALGRDPYFPPWTDTVQLNYFSVETREAMQAELNKVAKMCDGVRCDMAMLLLNSIIEKVWSFSLPNTAPPAEEFWEVTIKKVKQENPSFIFMAEVYWNLESRLQQLGFNYTYDKTLYDHLCSSSAPAIRQHLSGDIKSQNKNVRFIENHDEPRASEALGEECSKAAAFVISSIPGLRFYHEGQFEGRRIKLPVQMITEPQEKENIRLKNFYLRLLDLVNAEIFHQGEWKMLESNPAWNGNRTNSGILAWQWCLNEEIKIVVINYSNQKSQARIKLDHAIKKPAWKDEWQGQSYTYNMDEVNQKGIYVDLESWGTHVLSDRIE